MTEAHSIERVPAHDLKVGDEIIVDGITGDYFGRISEIVEYTLRLPSSPADAHEANTRCLCFRLPHLNTYRMIHDTVRRLVTAPT